ncbi:MAG: heme-binding domain-containing protein [Anaerolineae bacterium]|nr:heme-binding domain-containing protein [Anaerolineae bacterium]
MSAKLPVKRIILGVIGLVVLGFIVIQFVPGYERTNPPVTQQVNWNSPETEALMRRACYDCHSNETVWPWYSQIAPVSWLTVKDVNEGRRNLNFSTGRGELEAGELIEQLERGSMPPRIYLTMHPEANLSADEKAILIAGIRASLRG